MLRNYPATYLFLLSLILLMALAFLAPIVEVWHIYFAIALKIITFTVTIVCAFFLLVTIIELANGLFFRRHFH